MLNKIASSQISLIEKGFDFWVEEPKAMTILCIEGTYVPEIIKEYCIKDIIVSNDKVLINWDKRVAPLTDEEYNEKYKLTE